MLHYCNFSDVYQGKTYLSEHLDMDSIRKVDSVFYRDFVTDYSESGFISSNMYDIVVGQPVVKCYYSGGGQCQIPISYTRVWQGDHGAGMQSQVVTDYYDIFLTDDYKVWDAHFFRSETA
jgi:hypothetical protein